MTQNISFETGGIEISEGMISKLLTTIFPGNNHIDILILLAISYLIGLVTFEIFFYFSKKSKMIESMRPLQKTAFFLFFGLISYMTVFLTYVAFYILKKDPLGLENNGLLPLMIISGFLLYGCMSIASKQVKGRAFLIRTYRWLEACFILITMNFLMIALVYKTKSYNLLLLLILDIVYLKERFTTLLKK